MVYFLFLISFMYCEVHVGHRASSAPGELFLFCVETFITTATQILPGDSFISIVPAQHLRPFKFTALTRS